MFILDPSSSWQFNLKKIRFQELCNDNRIGQRLCNDPIYFDVNVADETLLKYRILSNFCCKKIQNGKGKSCREGTQSRQGVVI